MSKSKNNIREKQFVKSVIVLAFGTLMPKLASFITLPICTAYLSKIQYGTYDLITILSSFLLPLATLEIQAAAFRFLLDAKENLKSQKTIITTLYCFVIPISVITLTVLFVCIKLDWPLKIMVVSYYFWGILLESTRMVARGLFMNHKYSISAIINSFLNMGLVVIFLVVFKLGLNGLITSLLISVLVSILYLIISIRLWKYIDFSVLDKSVLVDLLRYSWPMVPNSISLWIIRMSDRLLISIFLGIEANAIYAVANKIPTILQLAQNTFSMAWLESASISVNDEDADEYYTKMFKIVYRFLAGGCAMLISFLPILFFVLIRGEYDEAYIQMPILLLAMFYSSVAVYLGGVFLANKKTKSIGITTIIAGLINIIVNIILIRQIGILAASLSTAISYFILMIYRMKAVKKFQNICFNYSEIVFTNFLLIVMSILCTWRSVLTYGINFFLGILFCILINYSLIKTVWRIITSKIKAKK